MKISKILETGQKIKPVAIIIIPIVENRIMAAKTILISMSFNAFIYLRLNLVILPLTISAKHLVQVTRLSSEVILEIFLLPQTTLLKLIFL